MKFFVHNFGCRANQSETQEWVALLEEEGYELCSNTQEANFAILNTCSVTWNAQKEVLGFIKKEYKRSNLKWFITGCTVNQMNEELQNKYIGFTFILNEDKDRLTEIITEEFPLQKNIIKHSAYRSRVFLKIQDGCNFRCSYCIVPFLRGKSRSLTPQEIKNKALYFTSLGFKEIVLSGINLSSYGYDLFPRVSILDVVKELDQIDDLEFIRLSSLDPRYISYQKIKELSEIKKLTPSFHFSFQSGNNAILKRMKRGSKVEEYKQIMKIFLNFFPDANYGADFIFGFPGETGKEFSETLSFIEESGLNYLHIFPFSSREGTKAANMPEKISSHIIKNRVNKIQSINKTIKRAYREKFIGKILPAIVVKEDENANLVITNNFINVKTPPIKGAKKKKVKVKIEKLINENICEGIIKNK